MPEVNQAALNRILLDRKKKMVSTSTILRKRETELKAILLECSVLPSRENRLNFNYDNIWRARRRNIFASNFFEDSSAHHRSMQFQRILCDLGGNILNFSPIEPTNHLRGRFKVHGVNGRTAEIGFTMTPESLPKIQYLMMKLL